MKNLETILSILPGTRPDERVAIVLAKQADGTSQLELRQQSRGEGVGWFTQSKVPLEPEQVAELRSFLGTAPRTTARKIATKTGFEPRVVHAETA